jgi:hypothetical protein
MVTRSQRRRRILDARRMLPRQVASSRSDEWLVVRDPIRHAVAQALTQHTGVVGEMVRRLTAGPTSPILERLGKVPMEEGDEGLNPVGEEPVDQPIVEPKTGRVHLACALWEDPGPADREAVGLQPQAGHGSDIFLPAVVVVRGDVTRLTVPDRTGLAAERVPDRETSPVFVPGAFDLVG